MVANVASALLLHIEEGRFPVRLLELTSKCTRVDNFPKDDSNGPVNALLLRSRYVSVFIIPKAAGTGPFKLTPGREILVTTPFRQVIPVQLQIDELTPVGEQLHPDIPAGKGLN